MYSAHLRPSRNFLLHSVWSIFFGGFSPFSLAISGQFFIANHSNVLNAFNQRGAEYEVRGRSADDTKIQLPSLCIMSITAT